jgi:hypothetical protein
VELSNGDYLHHSCLIKLQIREDEIETALQRQKPQLILSLFVQTVLAEQDVTPEAEIEGLSIEFAKLKSFLTSIYDYLPSWPPDWNERKRKLIRQNGSICSNCEEERRVYLQHEIPLCQGGTNELENLELICAACHANTYGKGNIFRSFSLNPSQAEFAKQAAEIQFAIDNHRKILFNYKKPRDRRWTTRVVVPERLLNILNNRDSGETLCVEGFCELRQDTRVFALERMQVLEVIED